GGRRCAGAVAVRPDGRLAAPAGPDGVGGSGLSGTPGSVVRFWEVESGRPFGTPLRFAERIQSLAFLPDGALVTAGDDGIAQVWDPATGRPLGPRLSHGDEVTAVAVHPAGGMRASAAGGGPRDVGPLRGVAVSPEGGLTATASSGGTARLWDARTGRPFGRPLAHQASVFSVAFRPDGRALLTTSLDHWARQ